MREHLLKKPEDTNVAIPIPTALPTPAPTPTHSSGVITKSNPAQSLPLELLDPQTGEADVAALTAAYKDLQDKLARMVELPGDDSDDETRRNFFTSLGVPETPEGYDITNPHELIEIDAEVNKRLHDAGFTPAQVQLVYDLAGEKMLPALGELAGDIETERHLDRLCQHFGGEEKWTEISKTLAAWGRANLPPDTYQALASSSEGIMVLYRMMESGEPSLAANGGGLQDMDEDSLRQLMRDPKYWREGDPKVIQQVTSGFKRLYPGGAKA